MKKLMLLIVLMIVYSFCFAEWEMINIGQFDSYLGEIKIFDGRNDGVQRIYIGCDGGQIVEWSYENDEWSMVVCGVVTGGFGTYANDFYGIWQGDPRGLGENRIYGANATGGVFEFYYTEDGWLMEEIYSSSPQAFIGIIVDDTRNDGVDRILTGGWSGTMKELSWNGIGWDMISIGNPTRCVWPLAVSNFSDLSANKYYCPEAYQNHFYEGIWEDGTYVETVVNTNRPPVKILTGTARNDGVERMYVSERNGHIQEFTYENNEWLQTDTQPGAPNKSRFGFIIADAINDGLKRIYSVAKSGAIRQSFWNGLNWEDEQIDIITGASTDISVGDVRNEGKNRVYVAASTGELYEYSFRDSTVSLSEDQINKVVSSLSAYPNPFSIANSIRSQLAINFSINYNSKVSLSIYDLKGRKINDLLNENKEMGSYTIYWDCKDMNRNKVPSGIYLYKLKTENQEIVKKLILFQ